ncbi:hypothetical protein C2G38_2265235 [Gigaspora rosea]|uniref:Uncharacterized protein n=1 Tax=Gigaspora rosea TaxID=44941 RepID=A0A397UL74_9GLOM|nr:hypothetical protein C2G38_2265235 [Gigaspora rosea]
MSDTVSENTSKKTKRGRKEANVWDHFNKEPVGDGHYSASCSYCTEKWNRGRPEDLKAHLALFCNSISQDIKIEYLEILATENSVKKMKKKIILEKQSEIFQDALTIKNILRNRQFWQDVEQLEIVLAPAKRAINAVETKSSNMALCFLELVKMAITIKNISNIIDSNFKKQCIKIYNRYWKQFDITTYLLAYFLHPKYRGKGCKDKVFREICLHAMKIWQNCGAKDNSYRILLNINHLQSMAQIHSFYITNMKSELKFSKENFNENELEIIINEISETLIENSNFFDEEENENENEEENNNDSFDLYDEDDNETNLNDLLIAELIDLNFYDDNEIENNLSLSNQQQIEDEENLYIDLEEILNEEFQN